MIEYTIGRTTVIEPEQGKTLTNGETYSKQVYLGISDSVSNWHEILDEDVPDLEEVDDSEAIEILLGGAS